MKKVYISLHPSKFYGHLGYHEWFYEWDSIEDAFLDICELYRTEKWWDYDGFSIYKGNPDWKSGFDKPYKWKGDLTAGQLLLLNVLKGLNFNMVKII